QTNGVVIALDSSPLTGAASWDGSAVGIPLVGVGTLTIGSGGTLTLAPGTLVQMSGGAIYVNSGGSLTLNGTAALPVTLTSANAAPSQADWAGIAFRPGSSGTLNYAQLLYGGGVLNGPADACGCVYAALRIDGANPTISHALFDHNYGDAIYIGSGSPTISSTTIAHTNAIGVHVAGGAPILTNDTFTANGGVPLSYDMVPATLSPSTTSGLTATGNSSNVVA